jgi:hypothetical protein
VNRILWVCALVISCLSPTFSQQPAPLAPAESGVPRLVSFGGTLHDPSGKLQTGIAGITFAIYKDQHEGVPLWLETQNVEADKSGHYTVQLGSSKRDGLPRDLFTSGEARWLGVQVSGQAEQPRVLLLSVPYALKAGDAETVGGLSPSAFVLATPPITSESASTTSASGTATVAPAAILGAGTTNFIPLWTPNGTTLGNSALFQTGGAGIGGKVGIGTQTPAAKLDVSGTSIFRGLLSLPATGTATATAGRTSQPLNFTASAFKSGAAAVNQAFRWQAEPVGNNTAAPSATLNLLSGTGAAAPTETGLKIAKNGAITFAPGQVFPSTLGTVKSVGLTAPASDFTVSGSPVTSTGTLNLAWKAAPTSADTANAIVKRDATGSFNATNITGTGTFTTTTANPIAIVGSTSVDGGIAIEGAEGATGGSFPVYGVAGASFSTVAGSTGVLGLDKNTEYLMREFTIGVQGVSLSPSGVGVLGVAGANVSSEFSTLTGFRVGVWGDAGNNQSLPSQGGVVGTADDGVAGYFLNNSNGYSTLVAGADGSLGQAFSAIGPNGYCSIDNGHLNCTGAKNTVVPIYGGKRKVAMSAIESPQNWFEDAGSAELVNGSAVVVLDPDFVQTVNSALDYKVFPVPNGDCKGLYVTNKTATSFEVRELGGGTASIRFDYRIMALRKNYEKVRFADHTNDPDSRKMMEEMKQRRKNATTAPVGPVSAKSPLMRPAISH